MVAASELPIDESASAVQMANEIFGNGATVVTASYSGSALSSGIYSNGDSIAPGATPSDTGIILSTGNAGDYTNSSGSGQANQSGNTSTNTSGVDNDALFNALAGTSTFDASILTVDFIPVGDTLSLQFIYASEEYPEYVNSIYNDLVGVWVNGAPVTLAVGDGVSDIGNVNATNNGNLYQDNTSSDFNTEMDGLTVTLTLTLNVTPGVVNTLRIGIADVGDSGYDSNLLIAAGSVQSEVLVSDDAFDVVQTGTPTLDVLGNDTDSTGGTLTITHVNGQAVSVGSTVTLASGAQITLNADGTFGYANDTDLEEVSFSYTAENSAGVSDTGLVTINTIPCFVAGTMVQTPSGARCIEQLIPGDLVCTKDDGPQPVRWIGTRTVDVTNSLAPIRIEAGTFGDHNTLSVSPQHRILIANELAEILFGSKEVLVAAKDLINDQTVRRDLSKTKVSYVHVLFDSHQVIFSEGLATESFLPGPQSLGSFEQETVNEICTLFPEIDPETGRGYGASVRTELKGYEAQLLRTHSHAA